MNFREFRGSGKPCFLLYYEDFPESLKTLLRLLPAVILGLMLPASAAAYELEPSWNVLCAYIPCSTWGGGAFGASGYVFSKVVLAMEGVFVAAAGLALFFAAARMTAQSHDEGAVSESRQAFIHAIAGAGVVGFARWLVMAFSPVETGSALVNTEYISQATINIITYARLILSTLLLANIVVQAFRLITSQGADDQTDKAKNRLLASFIGVGFVLLANVVMVAVNPELGNVSQIGIEIVGIANFLITLFGFGCVIVIALAGFTLALAADDGLKDKAKNMIKTAIIGVIILLVSYALVNEFIALGYSSVSLP